MEGIFGGLLEFESADKLIEFIDKIDRPTALKVLENAIEYGMKNGVYSLEEAYCLYVCLNKAKEQRPCYGYKEPSSVPEVDIDKDGKS